MFKETEKNHAKASRGKWDPEQMKKAIMTSTEMCVSVREAARKYDVPRGT